MVLCALGCCEPQGTHEVIAPLAWRFQRIRPLALICGATPPWAAITGLQCTPRREMFSMWVKARGQA